MLSIVLPTYNEGQNLPELLKRISGVLGKAEYEVIVVDDNSPDKTWKIAEELQKDNASLRVIRRVGRKGLSSAVVEGFDAAKGDTLLVMDSDLQHDPALILQLRDAITRGAGIAVASRYMQGGSVGDWVRGRRLLSKTATWLTRKIPAVEVSDPMSGFFALSKAAYKSVRDRLHPTGFKILFEVLGYLPRGTKAAEVPLVFKMRQHGQSKLSMKVQVEFVMQLVRIILIRFQSILFWLVCIIMALSLLPRAMSLLPLYTDTVLRENTRSVLSHLSERRGWLQSDIEVIRVKAGYVYIRHRPHRKGPDGDGDCYPVIYPLADSSLLPCVEE